MLSVDMILKKGLKGELDLLGAATKVAGELMSIPDFQDTEVTVLSQQYTLLEGLKKTILLVAGAAVQKLATSLGKEQEVLLNIADMLIFTYQAESALLRVDKLVQTKGEENAAVQLAIVKTYFYDAADKIAKAAKDALNAFMEGDELRMTLMGVRRFTKSEPFNAKDARQIIANAILEKGGYEF